MHSLLAILTDHLIDYAGLFPPASLSMTDAVAAYASARQGEHAALLGRFVVPASRLEELAVALLGFAQQWHTEHEAPQQRKPWKLSVLIGMQRSHDLALVQDFNQHYAMLAQVDSLELKASSSDEILSLPRLLPADLQRLAVYVEIDVQQSVAESVTALRNAGLYAKIRTGGITSEAFPGPQQVMAFLRACIEQQLAFKATAGLHHLLCGEYALSYTPDSKQATMFGFLNLLLATAIMQSELGSHHDKALELLLAREPGNLQLLPDRLCWQGVCLTAADLQSMRTHALHSFGSCSFHEPCAELAIFER